MTSENTTKATSEDSRNPVKHPPDDVERAFLAALEGRVWMSDRALAQVMELSEAERPLTYQLGKRLKGVGWVAVVRDPESHVSRAWAITAKGEEALSCPAVTPSRPQPSWPTVTVLLNVEHRTVEVSFVTDGAELTDSGITEIVKLPERSKRLSAWYYSVVKAQKVAAGVLDTTEPVAVDMYVAPARSMNNIRPRVVGEPAPGYKHCRVPLPLDPELLGSLERGIAEQVGWSEGPGSIRQGLRQMIAKQRLEDRAQAAEHNGTPATTPVHRHYPEESGQSVRAILSGLPGTRRR